MDDVVGVGVQIHVLVDLCRLRQVDSILFFRAAFPAIVHRLEEPNRSVGYQLVERGHVCVEEHSADKD